MSQSFCANNSCKNEDSAGRRTPPKRLNQEQYVVPEKNMRHFIAECASKAFYKGEDRRVGKSSGAYRLADMLIETDRRGHYSHGVSRLEIYLAELQSGVNIGERDDEMPVVKKRKGGTALVDGRNCLGVVVGAFCANLAIQMAKENGVAWVVARNSNHFGTCSHYAFQMAHAGFIGLTLTNSPPIVFCTGAAEKSLGSNPLCVVANAKTDEFALDMSTSNVAFGAIQRSAVKDDEEIPKHWSADKNGNATTNPRLVLQNGGLLPLGAVSGHEPLAIKHRKDSSYKGSGLSMMVELFTSILGGAAFGRSVKRWRDFGVDPDLDGLNLGHCFVALDPACFEDGFSDRLQLYIDEIHSLKRIDEHIPIFVPGDLSKAHARRCEEAGGLIYEQPIIDAMTTLAKKLDVPMFAFHERA